MPEGITAVVEEAGSDVFVIPKRKTETGKLREEQRKREAGHLLQTMDQAYSDNELHDLCFAWGIDYESISGDNKRAKIRSIIGHFYRRNTMQIFIDFLEGDRPDWSWRPDDPAKGTVT